MKSCKTCLRGPDRKSTCKCDDDLSGYLGTFFRSAWDKECFGQYQVGRDVDRGCELCSGLGPCRASTYPQRVVDNTPSPDDHQVGGDHYAKLRVQPWEAMESWLSQSEFCGYLQGNVIKYVARDKDDKLTDLRKAQHYLEKLIQTMESTNG